jgi:hypothetical protein
VVVDDYRCCNPAVDLLWRPRGSRDQAVKSCQVEQKTHAAPAAGSAFDPDHREGHHEAVYERQAGTAWKELGHMSTASEAVVPDAPGVQGWSGNLAFLGRLTLGEPLSSQRSLLCKEVRTCAAIPAWLAPRVDVGHGLDAASHSDLLCQSLAL